MLKFLNITTSLLWVKDPKILSEENFRKLIPERVTNPGNLSKWLKIATL